MKPFDLQRALAGDKVVTRDGRDVTQLTLFNITASEPLVAVVEGSLRRWTKDGSYWEEKESAFDLFMAPKTVKRWVNFYADGDAFYYDCEHDAIENVASHAIAIAVPVEFEEGYGCNE